MRSAGRFDADTPHVDGLIFIPPFSFWEGRNFGVAAVGQIVDTADQESYQIPASQSVKLFANIDSFISRIGEPDDLQTQNNASVQSSSSYIGPAPTGRPPFAGVSQFSIPSTLVRPKGIKVLDVVPIYTISTANLTTHTLTASWRTYADNTAAATVNTLINAVAQQTAFRANMYATKNVVAANLQTFQTIDLSQFQVKLIVTTPVTSVYNLFGCWIHVQFNFN